MKDLDIKKVWNQGISNQPEELNAGLVEKIIDKKSINIIDKFVASLKIEMWANFVVLTVIFFLLLIRNQWVLSLLFFLIDLGYFIYYKKLIKRLDDTKIDRSVIIYLQTVYAMINRFIAHNKVANLILSLPLFYGGVYIIDPNAFSERHLSNGWFIVLAAVCFTVAITLMYLFLYYVYGRKADKVKKLIIDLSKE